MTAIHPLRVSEEQIRQLKEESLVDLLDLLLVLEARENAIPLSGVGVSLRTKTPDGGLDGTIRWKGPPARTNFLTKPDVGFQCKAENLSPGECGKELVDPKGMLKPSVLALLQRGGAYVLFTTGSGGAKWNAARENSIRKKLIEVKAPKPQKTKIEIFGADRIRKWTDIHLAAAVFVSSVTGHPLIPGLKTWKEWNTREASKWAYFPDTKASALMKSIREELAKPRLCLRLNGLSGLGKTRLLMEALAPGSDPDPTTASVIYLDAAHQMINLPHYISEWKRLGRSGLLVVDNCTKQLHAAIQSEVVDPTSQFSAITVGLDPHENISGSRTFVLEPADEAHIKTLVARQVQGISDVDAQRIARWAGGFPFFALLLCEAWLAKVGLGSVQIDDLQLSKHLWGDSGVTHAAQEEVIKTCSLFESINVGDGDTDEVKFLTTFTGVNKQEFLKTLKAFQRRGTVERYGNYVRLRPHPLALRLCAEWWRLADKSRARELLDSVPESLVEPLCERLSTLDFLEEARDLTKELCGAYGPFGNAEVLSSERGARILRALTEVNPEVCADALFRVIEPIDIDALKARTWPRRQWVWALELLLFRKSTYQIAVQLLQKLAVAETETYSNSATGIWEQAFHIYLPGTETSLDERLEYLSRYFQQSEGDFPASLFVRAVDKAFEATHFSRSGGAEDQGSGPRLADYSPRGAEILKYWEQTLSLALRAVSEGRVAPDVMMSAFSSNIRGLLAAGADSVVSRMVTEGLTWRSEPWSAAIEALRDTLRFDARRKNKLRATVSDLLAQLEPAPTDVAGRLITIVSTPSWTDLHEDGPGGVLVEVGEAKAQAFGEECGANFNACAEQLQAVFVGEQRMGWWFGKGLANKIARPASFVELAKSTLMEFAESDANPIVLAGFLGQLAEIAPKAATDAIDGIFEEAPLRRFTPRLVSGMQPTSQRLMRLAEFVEDGSLPVSTLMIFGYGRPLDHLDPKDVSTFASKLHDHSVEGSEVGFFILYMYVFSRPDHWAAVRDVMRQFVLKGKVALLENPATHTVHEWDRVCAKLLEESPDEEVALALTRQIIELARTKREWRYDFPRELGTLLLSRFGAVTWPIFSSVLMGPSERGKWKLQHFLERAGQRDDAERRGPIDYLDQDILKAWIANNPEGAAEIARLALMETHRDAQFDWTPLGKWLIDTCYGNDGVLSAITANLLTGSWAGSREPYLKGIQELFRSLSHHKSKEVRLWAKQLVAALENDIARERDEYDARKVGRW